MMAMKHLPSLGAMALACLSPLAIQGQEAVAPWIGGLPGLEHPAAWGLGSGRVAAGMQHTERWAEGQDALQSHWMGAGWRLQEAGPSRPSGGWSLGWTSLLDRQAYGWTEGRHLVQAAVRVPLDKGWNGAAGIGIGVAHWTLDGRAWSWDAQYGPAGYNPSAPSGEADNRTYGGAWNPEITLGVAAERPVRRGASGPSLRVAASVHHALRPVQPHFLPIAADTVSRRISWWAESTGDLGFEGVDWQAWHRGSLHGTAGLAEFGGSLGRTFGSASRYTRDAQDHHIRLGILWRTDGMLRLPLTWQHGGVSCWLAPGLRSGHPSPAATGWAVGLTWSPLRDGVTPLAAR